jgi:hypothetical protein
MGFRGTKGHRTWRKHRQRLEQAGCIEAFAAKIKEDRAPALCIRLLKHWSQVDTAGGGGGKKRKSAVDEEAGPSSGASKQRRSSQADDPDVLGEADEDREGQDDPEMDDDGNPTCQGIFVEVTAEQQAVEMIARAGPAGITRVQLTKALGLDHKRFEKNSAELVRRHNLQVRMESKGRIINGVLIAPLSLQAQFLGAPVLALDASSGPLLALPPPAPEVPLTSQVPSASGQGLSEGLGGGVPMELDQASQPLPDSAPGSQKKTIGTAAAVDGGRRRRSRPLSCSRG